MREAVKQRIKECDQGRDIRGRPPRPRPVGRVKTWLRLPRSRRKSLFDIVIEIESLGGAQIVNFSMSDEDMRLIAKEDFVATASDGAAQLPDETVPHPRNYGTFSRKIGHYAIEERMFTMEQAIRSATGLPADIIHLKDRGYLKPGYAADLVAFDPEKASRSGDV